MVFTASDFGRTLTSNGNGSDHAWGGNVMVMGGDVNGGQIYGEYPSLALDGNNDVGGAILLPSLSTSTKPPGLSNQQNCLLGATSNLRWSSHSLQFG